MNINWKARLTSKTFWVAIVSAVVLLTQQLGLSIFPSNWADILNSILGIFILLGIIVDTSTSGLSDVAKNTITVQATNTEEKVQTTASTTEINNTVDVNSASSKISVDNPDNVQNIGTTVNHISASIPQ